MANAPDLSEVTGLCSMTLSGEVHREALEALRRRWLRRWAAAEFDDVNGFPRPDRG
jgi:hypothetical protein